jgi:hypothetical protein
VDPPATDGFFNYPSRRVAATFRTTNRRAAEKASMEAWFHCENPYPFVPESVLDQADSVRASLPNRYCDPEIAARLFEETLDEYMLCDELGLNITSSEHHAGINCLYGASSVVLGIVARQTKKIRLLSMGTLITVRNDPVRAAEEYAPLTSSRAAGSKSALSNRAAPRWPRATPTRSAFASGSGRRSISSARR